MMAGFQSFLLDINNDINGKDLEIMKFCCQHYGLKEKRLSEITEPYQLFNELKKRELLSIDHLDILVELLEKVDRKDLITKVRQYQGNEDSTRLNTENTDEGSRNKAVPTDKHIVEIAEDISTDWKMLGRKLNLRHGILESIDHEYRSVLEKACQMLSRWKKHQGNDATAQLLAETLIAIERRDVAELLQEICQKDGIIININGESQNSTSTVNQNGALATMPADLLANLPRQESTM